MAANGLIDVFAFGIEIGKLGTMQMKKEVSFSIIQLF